mgnify:CR=1 FL=1
MNNKMPRTPFSTPLSGSARETELRLKNIFSGPKKRPPVLFLALMFSLCVFCGNLVSCQVKEAEVPDAGGSSSQTDSSQAEPPLSVRPDTVPAGLENLSFSEGWNNSVNLDGLNARALYWSSSQKYLFFENAAFLSPYLAEHPGQGSAHWTGNGWDSLEVSWTLEGHPYGSFTVNLELGTMERNGVTEELSDQGLTDMARTMDYLMRAAEEYKKEADSRPPEEGIMPFGRPMELSFSSGAGGWATNLRIHPDGSFEGNYYDTDMGDGGEGYPYGTEYVCPFHGRFKDVVQIAPNSWSLTLEELVLDTGRPVGEEWIENGVRYVSSDPYGFNTPDGGALEPGAQFMLYSPEAKGYSPTDELHGMNGEDENSPLYQFWTWWPNKHGWGPYGDTLNCWGLHNLETGYGFFSDT